MRTGAAILRTLLVLAIPALLAGCEKSAELDRPFAKGASFDRVAADHHFCSALAQQLSLTAESVRHFEALMRMLAGKYCAAGDAEFVACQVARTVQMARTKTLDSQQCPLHSPSATTDELRQCGSRMTEHMARITEPLTIERATAAGDNMTASYYQEVCAGAVTGMAPLTSFR